MGGPPGAPGQGPPGGGANGPPSGNGGGGAEEPYDPLAALMAPPTRTYSRPSMSTMPSYGSMTSLGSTPTAGGMAFFNPGAAPPSIGNMGQPGQPAVSMWTPGPTAPTNNNR